MQYSPTEIDKIAKQIWSDQDVYKIENDFTKPKSYILDMFPYPSGAGLHVGHPLGYVASDIYARYKRMKGFNVLHPMGFDSFGLPAEQYAIETGRMPQETIAENIETYKKQFDKIGLSFDWSRQITTSDPNYYKWTQWIFIEMFNSIYCYKNQSAYKVEVLIKHFGEHGNHDNTAYTQDNVPAFSAEDWNQYSEKEKSDILMSYRLAYISYGEVNWCEELGTVLANDEVINGRSERGNHPVVKKKMRQWSLRITAYADRLLNNLEGLQFSNSLKDQQRNWIGKSTGALVTFPLTPSKGRGEDPTYKYMNANPSIAGVLIENAKNNRKNATEAEDKLWQEIRNRKLEFKFRRQHPIDIYIVDFVCLEKKLVIEVDAGYHGAQKEKDENRTKNLNDLGYRVIRFSNEDVVKNAKEVLINISNELKLLDTPISSGEGLGVRIYTTRPETIFGATFIVLAPEHPLVNEIVAEEYKSSVDKYVKLCSAKTEIDRQAEKEVSGQYTGAKAIHPITGAELPIYIAEYVLMRYGTGAIMAVPAEDERDRKFAEKFDLPIVEIFDKSKVQTSEPGDKQGVLMQSEFVNGMTWKQGFDAIVENLKLKNSGEYKTQYRLRDANFSRQRYWGEPFPILWKDNIPHTVPFENLPVMNPKVNDLKPSQDGRSPLARNQDWVNEVEGYERETDTMPAFAGSSWYFLRYMDPQNQTEFVNQKASTYWNQVDTYVGGTEHAVGHLLYSRFMNMVLFDRGFISFEEPYKRLINQGMIAGRSSFVYRSNEDANLFVSKGLIKDATKYTRLHVNVNFVENDELDLEKFKTWRAEYANAKFELEEGKYFCDFEVEKMSKSKYNVVNPDDVINKYGADTFRMYEMFLGPIEQGKPWNPIGIEGVSKFLRRFWSLYFDENGTSKLTDEPATKDELKILHKTMDKIEKDMESFSFNTSVSSFMIALNEMNTLKTNKREILIPFIKMIAPYAPHTAESIWQKLENKGSIVFELFPEVKTEYLQDDTVEYPISINGKTRTKIELPADADESMARENALKDEAVIKWMEGKEIKKFIFVKSRMINIVV